MCDVREGLECLRNVRGCIIPCCCDKTPERKNLREEDVILTYSQKGQAIMVS